MKWLLTVVWFSFLLRGQSAPERAEYSYRAGLYEVALQHYEAALQDPCLAAGPLLYALGNCAYRLGDYAAAALYYRRALLHLPDRDEPRFNLRLAQEQLGVQAPIPGPRGVFDWLDSAPALWLVALLQTAGLLGLLVLRRTAVRGLALLLLLFGLLGGLQQVLRRTATQPLYGVVQAQVAPLRQQPGQEAAVAGSLQAGEVVEVGEGTELWLFVRNARGSGWVERTALELVD